MGSGAPAPPNYRNAAEQQANASAAAVNAQTQANRPDITTPFAQQQWTQGPNGQWNMSTGFTGPMAGAAQGLQQQAAANMATPFSFGQFGQVGTGDAARDSAINAAYGQAASRLNPQWQQREEAQRTQLLNQGLTPGTAAYQQAMGNLGQQRNDAYNSAMNSAIGQGTAAGDSAFRNNMMARQQSIAEALRQRGMPMDELQGMQGLLAMPGFQGAGAAQTPQYLQAMMGQDNANMQRWQAENQQQADWMQGGMSFLSALPGLFALSDFNAKTKIVYMPEEVLPGVRLATWEYRGWPGERWAGVIAQELEAVAPQYVHTASNGMKFVDYSFLLEDAHV